MKKKAKKKEMITVLVVEQNALSGNYMESILKSLHAKNDRQDESLTGQVHDQAGHCPLTGRYFKPCINVLQVINRTASLLKTFISDHPSIGASETGHSNAKSF